MNKIVNNPPFEEEENVETEELETEQSEEHEEIDDEAIEEPEGESPEEGEEPEEEEQTITIGDQEFTKEELQDIVSKGSKVKQWEEKMPGFDVDKLMPDYTKKSQRLAAYEKGLVPKQEEKEDLSELGIDQEQVKLFEKVAKNLGFVRNTDLAQNSVEAQKEAFLQTHKEYSAGSPNGDARWSALMEEFSLYNWQAHPQRVGELLEKAHAEIAGRFQEPARGEETQKTISKKQAQAALVALGGSGKKSTAPKPPQRNNEMADKFRAMGWSEEDINDVLS